MFDNRRFIPVVLLLIAAAMAGCGGKEDESAAGKDSGEAGELATLQDEYCVLKSELELAKSDSLYLVIDAPGERLVLKQRGTVLWDQPIEVQGDGDGPKVFAASFVGDSRRFVRKVEDVHLYAFSEQSPDSVLKIVSETVRTTIDRMQRIIPERFDISWQDDLILEVVTGIPGRPESKFSNILTAIHRIFQQQGHGAKLVIRMDASRSVTFYRIAARGLPTLVIPG